MIGALWRRLARPLVSGRLEPAITAVVHCHDPDLVPELARALRRLPARANVHVTSSRPAVFERWRGLGIGRSARIDFHETENRGRDIRPFFEVVRGLDLAPEDLVLKLHGKRSRYSAQGDRWRRDLVRGLLPDSRAPGRVRARFRADPRLGMIGAPASFVSHPVYWGENRPLVARILTTCFGEPPAEPELGFFAGTMFWVRGELLRALAPLVDLDAFEPEPLPQDGAYAHALERILPMAAARLGWHVAELGRSGTLDPERVRSRKVPYL